MQHFSKVTVGGTFDHFHKGHKALLQKAIAVSKSVVIGLTTDQWIKRKPLNAQVESYKQRKKAVSEFLKSQKFNHFEIIKLNDIYGTTLTDPEIKAMVVSNKTLEGAKKVNKQRKRRNLPPLPIIVARTEVTESGHCISSEYIRRGLTNRQGKVYSRLFKKSLKLSDKARLELKKPQGILLSKNILEKTKKILKENKIPFICLVGDYTTQVFEKNKLNFDIVIIDQRILREPTDFVYQKRPVFKTKNPRGFISPSLVKAVKKAIENKKGLVKVDGEEDLAAVALVLNLPLDSLVFYGQPKKGSVAIKVNEKIKEKFYRLLK